MEIDWLKTFLEVYRVGSMGRAAQALSITQPAVSQHISALESKLGAPLFKRSRKGVQATAMADSLASDVADAIDVLEQAISNRRIYTSSVSGLLHIGAAPEVLSVFGVRIIDAFADTLLRFEFHPITRPRLFDDLQEGAINIALTTAMPNKNKFLYAQIYQDQLKLVGHPKIAEQLRGRKNHIERLLQLPMVTNSRDMILLQQFWKVGLLPDSPINPKIVMPDLQSIASICEHIPAWAVLPNFVLGDRLEKGMLVNLLPASTVKAPLYMVWQRQALRTSRVAFAIDRIKQISFDMS